MSARITRHTAKRLKTEEASAINPLINHGSDILICIAPYLSVVEMVNLALTNRHFGLSTGDDQLSLMEDVVRQVIINEQTEYEDAALPKYEDESYLQLYHQHKMLRKPLQFDQLVGKNLQYVVDGEEEDKTKVFVRPANNSTKTAISNNIMRAGKHFVEFSSNQFPRRTSVGIMRPVKGWGNKLEKGKPVNHLDPTILKKPFSKELLATRTERWGDSNVNACMYHYSMGRHCTIWSNWQQMSKSEDSHRFETWAAQTGAGGGDTFSNLNQNTVLGLLLDLDEGMMTVYKNGQRRGVMKTGLSGEYVWAVSMDSRDSIVGIRRAPIPSDYDPSQNQVIPAQNWMNMDWLAPDTP